MLFAEFVVWAKASGRAESYTRRFESHFRAHFSDRWKRIEQLSGEAIERYKVERAAAVKSVTVYKELVTLSRFLRWARKHGHIHEVPQFDRLRPVSDYEPPNLTPEEARIILAELPDRAHHPTGHPVRELFTVQWAQALRPGDVMHLRWSDVDLRRETIAIRKGVDKARTGRVVPMAAASKEVFSALARETHLPTALIFGVRDYRTSLDRAIARINKRLRRRRRPLLPHITPHHFRHFRLSELGANTRDVAALSFLAGHKHLATTDRYVRSRTERARAVLEAVQ